MGEDFIINYVTMATIVIQHDFLNFIIGGYLHTKFKVSSITHSGDISRGPTRSPQPWDFQKSPTQVGLRICGHMSF